MSECYFYAIGCHCNLPGTPFEYAVKFGIAADPFKRRASLQTANPSQLEILFVEHFPTRFEAMKFEQEVHQFFDSERIGGEWFAITKNLVHHRFRDFLSGTPWDYCHE